MNDSAMYECRDWNYGRTAWKEWSLKAFFPMLKKRSILTVSTFADMLCYPEKAYLINKRSDDWRFYLITRGNGYFQRKQDVFSFSAGSLIVVAPQDTSSSFHILSPSLQMRKLGFVNSSGIQTLCVNEVSGTALYHPGDFELLLDFYDKMLEAMNHPDLSGETNRTVSQFGYLFLYEVEAQCFNPYYSDPINSIYNAINAFPDKPYSIPELAKTCGTSIRNLQRIFKKQTGSTIQSLITTCRIGLARNLLQNTFQPVFEIASQCCYKNFALFCRTFKQKTGMTPNEFRQKYAAVHPFTNTSNLTSGLKKTNESGIKELSQRKKELLWQINEKRNITIKELAVRLKINPSAVQKHIDSLKRQKLLQRIGSRRSGVWKISQPEQNMCIKPDMEK